MQENLKEEIAADLAFIWGCGPEEISREIENFFRVNSWTAKQRNLPRDVVIYFSRRSLRNDIIQAFYKQRFQIASQDVIILKEIPSKILRERKDFAFLTEELKKHQVRFRWVIPVGLMLNYAGTYYRLDTILKARDFYVSVLKAGISSSPRLKRIEQKFEERLTEGISAAGQVDFKQQLLEIKDDLKQGFSTSGTGTTCGTLAPGRWYATILEKW